MKGEDFDDIMKYDYDKEGERLGDVFHEVSFTVYRKEGERDEPEYIPCVYEVRVFPSLEIAEVTGYGELDENGRFTVSKSVFDKGVVNKKLREELTTELKEVFEDYEGYKMRKQFSKKEVETVRHRILDALTFQGIPISKTRFQRIWKLVTKTPQYATITGGTGWTEQNFHETAEMKRIRIAAAEGEIEWDKMPIDFAYEEAARKAGIKLPEQNPVCKICGGRTRHGDTCSSCSRRRYYEHYPPKKRRSSQEVWAEARRKEREKCAKEGHRWEQREGYRACLVCGEVEDTLTGKRIILNTAQNPSDRAKAIEHYRLWHHFEPTGEITVDIPGNVKELNVLGTIKRLDYLSDKDVHDKGGRRTVYYHHHFRKNHPYLAIDKRDVVGWGILKTQSEFSIFLTTQ